LQLLNFFKSDLYKGVETTGLGQFIHKPFDLKN